MGFPAIAGLVLSAIGTGTEMYANAQTQKNENQQANQVVGQEKLLQNKATNLFNQNLPGNDAAHAQKAINTGAQQQQGQYSALASQPLSPGVNPVSISPIVQARADASTQNIGNANAKLQGYSQWGVNQAIQNMLAGQQIGLVNNQASQLYNTLGPRLQQASQSEAGLSGVGSLLSTLGSAVGVGGSLLGGAGGASGLLANSAKTAGNPFNYYLPAEQLSYGALNAY